MASARRTLVILRHAKSAWPEGVRDTQRPLATRGRRDAPAAGRWLHEHVPEIELIMCSPALRARETCELVATELDALPEIRYDEELYAAPDQALLDVIRELPSRVTTVLIIGHNPGLEDLVALLTRTAHQLKTASVAVLTGHGEWNDAPDWTHLTTSATPRGT